MKTTRLQWVYHTLFTLSFLFLFATYGCKDSKEAEVSYDPKKPLVCESFFPDEGGVGTKLIIRGSNFGNDPEIVKVWIANDENRPAKVIGITDERIYAVVPARADSGFVTVQVGEGDDAQSYTFTDTEFQYEYRRNVSTLCGGSTSDEMQDGPFRETQFYRPMWLVLDNENNLFVMEEHMRAIRMLDLTMEETSTPLRIPNFNMRSISFSPTYDSLHIGIEGGGMDVSTLVALRDEGFIKYKVMTPQTYSNASIANPVSGDIFINQYYTGEVYRWDVPTQQMVLAARPMGNNSDFSFCWSLDGKKLFCIGKEGMDDSVIVSMEYDLSTKTFSEPIVFAGAANQPGYADGQGEEARFSGPYQMTAGPDGDYFLADTWNHCIRRITANGMVTTYAGQPGNPGFTEGDPLKEAQFQYPTGVAMSLEGDILYVADKENKRICKILVE